MFHAIVSESPIMLQLESNKQLLNNNAVVVFKSGEFFRNSSFY